MQWWNGHCRTSRAKSFEQPCGRFKTFRLYIILDGSLECILRDKMKREQQSGKESE